MAAIAHTQDGIEEVLTRRGAMIAAVGVWSAGLLVGALAVWHANAPASLVERGVTEVQPESSSVAGKSRVNGEPPVGPTDLSGAPSGAMVFPEDVLVGHRAGGAGDAPVCR
jgi:hypothetical protein